MSELNELIDSTWEKTLSWFNEPAKLELLPGGGMRVYPAAPTDFWQRTHYGFRADSGHLPYQERHGDFEMETQVRFHPVHQYDQAGLMVRFSPDCWLKTSVEYEPDGPARLGAVVTNNGYSDWSTQDFAAEQNEVRFRIRRIGADFHVHFSAGGGDWSQLRIAHLFEAEDASIAPQCGLYACCPQGAGFFADFSYLRFNQ
jgi:uncharacterized protein